MCARSEILPVALPAPPAFASQIHCLSPLFCMPARAGEDNSRPCQHWPWRLPQQHCWAGVHMGSLTPLLLPAVFVGPPGSSWRARLAGGCSHAELTRSHGSTPGCPFTAARHRSQPGTAGCLLPQQPLCAGRSSFLLPRIHSAPPVSKHHSPILTQPLHSFALQSDSLQDNCFLKKRELLLTGSEE